MSSSHTINALSWQPVLVGTLLDECNEILIKNRELSQKYSRSPVELGLCSLCSYLTSDRGWKLQQVISQTPWKISDEYSDIDDLCIGLIRPLKTCLLSIKWDDKASNVDLNGWNHLLQSDDELLKLVKRDRSNRLRHLKCHHESSIRARRVSRPRVSTKRQMDAAEWSDSSGDYFKLAHTTQLIPSTRKSPVRAQKVNVSPYILHEDSDGFPLCWNEDAPMPSTNGAHLWLDDMILELLYNQLPEKADERTDTGAALMLLSVLKKALEFIGQTGISNEQYVSAVVDVLTNLFSWDIPDVEKAARELFDDFNLTFVQELKRSFLIQRHWADVVIFCLSLLATRATQTDSGKAELIGGIRILIDRLRVNCDLLYSVVAEGAELKDEYELWRNTDGSLDYLLATSHRLSIGLASIVCACLDISLPTYLLADSIQLAVQVLSVLSASSYSDSVRDLAIICDLLGQYHSPIPVHRIRATSTIDDSSPSNLYQTRLYVLMTTVANVGAKLQEAKTFWLHCSVCRRPNHDRCAIANTPIACHHHGILEFGSCSNLQITERSDSTDDRCGCAFCIKILFDCAHNVSDVSSKEMALVALQKAGKCCCLPSDVFLTNLLSDLPNQPASIQKHLLQCVRIHIGSPNLVKGSQSSGLSSPTSSEGKLFSCRFCERNELTDVGFLANSGSTLCGYVTVLSDFFKSDDSIVLDRLCRLVWAVHPCLSSTSKEQLESQAIIPCLARICDECFKKDQDPATTTPNQQHIWLINSLLSLATASLSGPMSYKSVLKLLLPRADCLFLCPDSQSNFVSFIKCAALLESSLGSDLDDQLSDVIKGQDWPINKYIFDKFLMGFRLAQQDLVNLISDLASQFWLVVTQVLDLCRFSLGHQSVGFVHLFNQFGGRTMCCQLISACLSQISQQSDNDWLDSRSAQRLTGLLGQTLNVSLLGPSGTSGKENLLSLLETVFCCDNELETKKLAKNPSVIHRLCCMLIDCAIGMPIDFNAQTYEQSQNKKLRSSTFMSESESSVGTLSLIDSDIDSNISSSEEEGYKGDIETGPLLNDEPPPLTSLQHPELCVLALRFLLNVVKDLDSMSSRDFVISSTIQRLQLVCLRGTTNLKKLREKGLVPLLYSLAQLLVEKGSDPSVLRQELSLLAGFICADPSSHDLELLLKLLNNPHDAQCLVFETLLEMFQESHLEPTEWLQFPQLSLEDLSRLRVVQSSPPIGLKGSTLPKRLRSRSSLSSNKVQSQTLERPKAAKQKSAPASAQTSRPGLLRSISSFFSSSKKISSASAPVKQTSNSFGAQTRSFLQRPFVPPFCHDAAVLLKLNTSTITLGQGISVSCWLRLTKTTAPVSNNVLQKEWYHVLTMGADDLNCSLYTHGESEQAMLKIVSRGDILEEKKFKKFLPLEKWSHLTTSMQVVGQDSLKLFIAINGIQTHAWELGWSCEAVQLNSPFTIGFGCLLEYEYSSEFILQIGNVSAFRGAVSHLCALVLFALGPRCSSVVDTKSRMYDPCLHWVLKPGLLCQTQVDGTQLVDDIIGIVEALQKNLVFTYLPSNRNAFGVYTVQPPQSAEGETLNYLCLTRLSIEQVEWKCEYKYNKIKSLDDAFSSLGGARLLLLLYAKTVDLSMSAETQAAAFRLLFVGVKRNPEWWHTFQSLQGSSLVSKVLTSHLAVKDNLLLNEMAIASLGGFDHRSHSTETAERSCSFIIHDPLLLSSLLTNAEIWKHSWNVWEQALSFVVDCLSEKNPFNKFNIYQLNKVHFLKNILFVCLEITQEPTYTNLPSAFVANSLVPLVAALIGQPPEVSRMTELWDFLFLSHPAACTYLNYRIAAHDDWVVQETLNEEPVNLVRHHESLFVGQLRKYMERLGSDRISQIMKDGNGSVMAVRRAYTGERQDTFSRPVSGVAVIAALENMTPMASSDENQEVPTPSASAVPPVMNLRDSIPRLPDLVCDIDPDTVEKYKSGTTSSGEEWSVGEGGSSAFTEEYVSANDEPLLSGARAQLDLPWVVETRAGLLKLVSMVLVTGPDAIVTRLVSSVIKWESLVAMLNHQSHQQVRAACVQALCALLMRSDDSQRLRFLRSHGFSLIANQLREYPCSLEVADSLFSLLCGEFIRLEDGLDSSHLFMLNVDRFQCGVLEPIFAVLENSVHDLTVFWNVASSLQKVFENSFILSQAMLDKHVIETLVNVLMQLANVESRETDLAGVQDNTLMVECWHSLTSRVLQNCIAFSDLIHHQACVELMTLLFAANWQCANQNNQNAKDMVRRQLCSLLQIWLECIRTLYTDEGLSASMVIPMDCVSTSSFGSGRSTPTDGYLSSGSVSSMTSLTSTIPSHVPGLFGGSFSNLKQKIRSLSTSSSQLSLKGRYRGNNCPSVASHSELVERLKLGLQYCADLFLHLSPGHPVSEEEEHLFEFYLYFLLNTVKKDLNKESGYRRRINTNKSWQRLLWSCRDKVRQQLAYMVAFVLFPAASKLGNLKHRLKTPKTSDPDDNWVSRRQFLIARTLAHEVQYKQMLKTLLDINLDYQYAMLLALHELILIETEPEQQVGPEQIRARTDAEKLLRFLRHMKINSPLYQLDEERLRSLSTDERLCLQTYQDLRQNWLQKLRAAITRLKLRQQNVTEPVSEMAMSVTCSVVEEQNVPRKLFIQRCKTILADSIEAEQQWRMLADDLCHPAAVGYDEKSWPSSWGLDPTEGPGRERRRLIPFHLGISERFVQEPYRYKLKAIKESAPLNNLWQDQTISPHNKQSMDTSDDWDPNDLASQLINRLRIDEKIAYSTPATILRSTFECSGEILLGDKWIYFVGERSQSSQKGLPYKSLISMSWAYGEVVEVYKRHHQLLDTALEIFFNDGETFLISFEKFHKRNDFLHRLMSMDLANLTTYSDNLLQAATQWWREGLITNFEYLMHLNKLAGRTFSDLMQYPVFPFILSDYSSLNLDLTSPIVFRNLAKPIAIQDRKMEDHYIKVYKCLENEARRAPPSARSIPLFGPYNYGSHYSNSGIVVHYLVRVPPFTSMALEYQDDNFDIPDRLFNSIETTWRLSSSESTTDFKELIPEFFFFPEFLTNFEGLELGVRQAGMRVGDVALPPWVPDSDPRLFINIHRQALESAYVTANLHEWIDLVFGYKQTGAASIDAVNVFHPATYHGTRYEGDECQDDLHMNALKTMVKTYGQMPKQLFRAPHLPHFIAKPLLPGLKSLVKGPVPSVNGIRWGSFVGSPEASDPVLVLKQRASATSNLKPTQLTVVSDGTCVGLTDDCQLLVKHRATKRELSSPWATKEVDSLAVVCWSFPDCVLRGRIINPEPGGPWMSLVSLHDQKVTCSAYSLTNCRLFLGFKSGLIGVYTLEHLAFTIKSCSLTKELVGHHGQVSCIDVCPQFSVVVSGSTSGQLFLWDLNKLSFVRSLSLQDGPVSHCAVSKTTCDMVSVCQIGYGSRIMLQTVNGRYVGYVDCDICVCSLALTSLPEGTAVNCVTVGLQNGIIRMFNMWNLAPVREISHCNFLEPVKSLSYAHACKKLYACTQSGTVLCWECTSSRQSKPPRFIFATPKL